MKLGFVSAILPELPLEEVLAFASAEGFECVELMCWPPGKAERRYAGVTRACYPQAPLVLCVCGVLEEAWVRGDGRSHLDVDAAILMDHLVLAATDEGLGTCWIANFDVAAARAVFELRPGEVPLLLTTLGRAADRPGEKERKRLDEIVRRVG